MSKPLIITHNDQYQADDVFGVAVLLSLYPDHKIIRTRDDGMIDWWFRNNQIDGFMVDIGMEYDHEKRIYDHHQSSGAGKRSDGTPYAAAGLVWKHYGHELVRSVVENYEDLEGVDVDIEKTVAKIDGKIVKPIDAYDNGMTLKARQDHWIRKAIVSNRPLFQGARKEHYDENFKLSVSLCQNFLREEIIRMQGPAIAEKLINQRGILVTGGRVLVMDTKVFTAPWLDKNPRVLFHMFPNRTGQWECYSRIKEKGSFEPACPFPEEWSGLDGKTLADVSGISSAVFCHSNSFVFVANSKKGCIRAVQKTLSQKGIQ